MKKKWGIVILAAVLTAVFLAAGSSGIKRVPYDGSRFVLTEQELREEIWLLQISGEHSTVPSDVWLFYLTISDDVPVCLYLLDSYKGALYINGEKAVQQDMLLGNIVMLPAGCTQYKIELRPAADHFLYMTRNYIYVGTQSHIWENMRQTQWRQGMFAGLFFFSALFALTLFMWKRSETYLIFYVVHALIVLVLSVRSELASAQFLFLEWCRGAYRLLLSVRGAEGILQSAYILLTSWVHARLYRAFVDDSIGGVSYFRYLQRIFALLAAASVLLGPALNVFFISHFFYFCVYLGEGYVLLHNPSVIGQKSFRYVLLAAWSTSFSFWLVRAANNLGIFPYPYSVSSYIALSYTIGFLFCISGKFSLKFVQADLLQRETAQMNEHLENLVEQRTEDLKETCERLEQVQQAKNQFISNIIHNLKTPLFSVQGYAELIEEQWEQDADRTREYAGVIRRNMEYVQGMIRQLSLFNRLEEGRIIFHRAAFDWNGMIRRSLEGVEIQRKEKNISIRTESEEERILCDGDELYLRQAVQCVLDNAIRHSAFGGQIHIKSRANGQGAAVAIRVINLGGNILTIGGKADGTPWQIGLQYPVGDRAKREKYWGLLHSRDNSIVTSGCYERGFWRDGTWYHHILDPRSGMPVQNRVLSVTVRTKDSFLADAVTTPLLILGERKGMELAERYGVEVVYYLQNNEIVYTRGTELMLVREE